MSHPRYPAYKDSGVEWLGEVPAHWEAQRLKYTVHLRNQKVEAQGNAASYIGLENIESQTGNLIGSESALEPEGVSNCYYQGDVLFGKLRPYLAKVYEATQSGICTSELLVMEPRAVTSRFLHYWLLADHFIRVVDSSTFGAKMPRASWEFIGNMPSLVPLPHEQAAIAAFLDRETATIAALIANQQRLIALLQEKRQALIAHAVTKGLNPDAPMRDSGVEWIGQIPAHWEVRQLGYVAREIQTGPFGSQLHAEDYIEGGTPVINPANIRAGMVVPDYSCTIDETTCSRLQRHAFRQGDIVFARRGEMGRCALITDKEVGWLCGTGCLNVRFDDQAVDSTFVVMALGTPGVKEQLQLASVGSTMENLNTSILARTVLPTPPLVEQKAIVAFINNEADKVYTLITKAKQAIELLREHRTSLISAAVTGKIDVREAGREAGRTETSPPEPASSDTLYLSAGELLKLPGKERERILTRAVAEAEAVYRTDRELTDFEAFAEADLYDDTPEE